MNRNHYVVYWNDATQSYLTTTPHEWARQYGHRHGLPEGARTSQIEDVLKSLFRFVEFTYETSVVLCHMDTQTPNF
jgi:hypothetical protein